MKSTQKPLLSQVAAQPLKKGGVRKNRSHKRYRKLWHIPSNQPMPLGCTVCPERGLCGGLSIRQDFFDCLQFCCNTPNDCDRVCRRNPEFPQRVREVGGLNIFDTGRAPTVEFPNLPSFVPIVYHRSRLEQVIEHPAVCVPLYSMFYKRTGEPIYRNKEEFCAHFRIRRGARVILSGTEDDPLLERWWALGTAGRRRVIQALRGIGVDLVTVPNYSLFTDRPRWDDLHAMNRIAITHKEFLDGGIAAALHINGRTDKDFDRWAEYIKSRPEVRAISYEFGTGAGWSKRRQQHVDWLCSLARQVDRPLDVYIRGGMSSIKPLAKAFSSITLLDTNAFLKAEYRQKAERAPYGKVQWVQHSTKYGQAIDEILDHNIRTIHAIVDEQSR